MKSKLLIIFSIILAILFISTISFANNDVKNGIHSATDTMVDGVSNLANDVRSGVRTAENVIEDGAKNLGNAISDGAQDLGNTVSDGINDVDRTITDNDGYTTTRTATGTTSNTMNSSLWTWIILAVAAVIIVGLVWYYAAQTENRNH